MRSREREEVRGGRSAHCAALAVGLLIVSVSMGAPPIDPLPAPFYSFDLASPRVIAGLVGAADILAYAEPDPEVVVPASALGFVSPGDDLDALSHLCHPDAAAEFSISFSVDRETVGLEPPEWMLVSMGVPHNPLSQAERGQAAGDQYAGLTVFSVAGVKSRPGGRPPNSALVRNNFNEGGTSFSASPDSHASGDGGGESQDNVDGTGKDGGGGGFRQGDVLEDWYFSATAASPSLELLPGSDKPSGAHVFYNARPVDPLDPTDTELYATFLDLGLQQADDVDGLIVLDLDADGSFSQGDVVLFSLAPGSPSLGTIPGSPADVFRVTYGAAPMLFADAIEFGLGASSDNTDSLDMFPCMDGTDCALQHGIRADRGDMNCDHVVNFDDIDPFVTALVSQGQYELDYPLCNWWNGDCDESTDVNFDDIDPFVTLLVSGGAAPSDSDTHLDVGS